jgi:PKD repeat protein
MTADVTRVTTEVRDAPPRQSPGVRFAVLLAALATVTVTACQKDATPDPFIGPSELGLSLALSASPDVLPLDGSSQSLVSILARDGSGQPIPSVSVRLQTRFGGVLQDLGQLSARTLVTGQDGRALATYTAPIGGSVDTQAEVEILVTPVGENYASAVPRTLAIRLVPTGIVVPPASFSAGFRFTPATPIDFQNVLFETNCLFEGDTNCVTGVVESYVWDFGDGTTGSGTTVTHAYADPSTNTVALTVTDGFGRSAISTRLVTVTSGIAPTPSFAFSPTTPDIGETVFFNASASVASSGRSIVSYAWAFGDGDTGAGVTVSHIYEAAGTYSVTLTITDDRGGSNSFTTPVIVTESKPTASFVFSPTEPTTSTVVLFNAVASFATSGRLIASYDWNFGDGSTATGVTTTHTFTAAAEYTVTLTVADTAGQRSTASSPITVTP